MAESKLGQGILDAGRNARSIPQNTGEQYPQLIDAVVLSGDSTNGYTVQALKADLTAAIKQWTRVATRPSGGTLETGAQVVLIIEREGDVPRILQTGGGSGGTVVLGVPLGCRYFSSGS
jgi:hypothetical protein